MAADLYSRCCRRQGGPTSHSLTCLCSLCVLPGAGRPTPKQAAGAAAGSQHTAAEGMCRSRQGTCGVMQHRAEARLPCPAASAALLTAAAPRHYLRGRRHQPRSRSRSARRSPTRRRRCVTGRRSCTLLPDCASLLVRDTPMPCQVGGQLAVHTGGAGPEEEPVVGRDVLRQPSLVPLSAEAHQVKAWDDTPSTMCISPSHRPHGVDG